MMRSALLSLTSAAVLTVLMPQASKAADIQASSDITAATVYQNRAKIDRRAAVDVPQGAHSIIISGLPTGLDPNTIRVAGNAAAQVVIGTVKHELVNTPELTDEREKKINDQLQALQDQVAMIEADKKALNARQKFMQNLGQNAEKRSDEALAELNLNSGQWSDAAAVIQKDMADILKAKLQLDFKARDLNAQIQALKAEMNKLRGGRKNFYEISVAIEAAADTTLTLDVSYQMRGASWRPVYDARLDMDGSGKTNLDIVQYGSVRQNTGEDWDDIELTLSTAQPHRATTLPELSANWVNIHPENSGGRSHMQSSRMRSNDAAGYAEMDMMAQELVAAPAVAKAKLADAAYQGASVESNGFSVEYKIAGEVDVPSDGSESKLRIGVAQTEHVMQTHIRPQISQNAFLTAKMTLKGDAPLLAGEASLYRDDAFIGKGHIPFLMPNKEHYMSFGMNDNVTVAMKTLKEERKEAGMILSENTFERHMVTNIENISAKDSYDIIVQQRVPTSQNKDLKVEILDEHTSSGYQTDWNDVKGVLHWEGVIAPSSEESYELGYKLHWPKGYVASGRY